MSMYQIKPVYAGKRAFFSIIKQATPTEKEEIYEVQVQVGCTCAYGSYKSSYGGICRHARMAIDQMRSGNPFMEIMGPSPALQARRNECMQLVRPMNRKLNQIRYGENEGVKHRNEKDRICERLQQEGKHFVCEAIFEKGEGRADILVLDEFRVIEIASSETDESLAAKRLTYPPGLDMTVVRV